MKLIILFQIGNIDIALNILNKIYTTIINFNSLLLLSIIETEKNNEYLIYDYFKSINFTNYYINYHINKGMDIGPFLLQLKEIFKKKLHLEYDILIKLHTKTDNIWRNELIEPIFNTDIIIQRNIFNLINDYKIICSKKWLLELDIINETKIIDICNNNNIKNIFYDVIDKKLYEDDIKNNRLDKIDNIFYKKYYKIKINTTKMCNKKYNEKIENFILKEHMNKYKNIPSEKYIIKNYTKNIFFVGGTIFAIDIKILYDFFSKINLNNLYDILEYGLVKNEQPTNIHSIERLLTMFIYYYDYNIYGL